MTDWGPVFVSVVLFILLTPGLLVQIPGRNKAVEFGNFQTSGVSICVHSVIYFVLVCIFLLALQIHIFAVTIMKVHVPAMGSECQLLHEMSTKTRETTQQDTKRSIPLDLSDNFHSYGETQSLRMVHLSVGHKTAEGAEKTAKELVNKLVVIKVSTLKLLLWKAQAAELENQDDEA
ncbi:hypothetical protein C5167_021952 [Papaver somniferum]|uniref:Uncharacterized protein n=1 Tax=Papaver somniferum TaxID=3469 RepID=A0A4Y7JK58_PAPSO|nr:hypothetical protein C5167_021952 [Papaver somniferum]